MEESDYQVVFSNLGRGRKRHPVHRSRDHLADWVGHLVTPSRTFQDSLDWIPEHSWPLERLIQWARENQEESLADGFVDDVLATFVEEVPDSTSLDLHTAFPQVTQVELAQLVKAHFGRSSRGYEKLLEMLSEDIPGLWSAQIVEAISHLRDEWFPAKQFEGQAPPVARYKGLSLVVPIRVVAALVCTAFAGEESNRADHWYRTHLWESGQVKLAGCRFTHALYILRRHTQLTPQQLARMLQINPWK